MRALARQPSDDKRQSATWKRGVIKCRGIQNPAFSLPREVSHEGALGSKTKRDLILLLFDKLEILQAYDIVKIYYDAGRGMVTDALHAAFEYVPSKQVITCRNCSPADFRLQQTADFICEIELTVIKYEANEASGTERL